MRGKFFICEEFRVAFAGRAKRVEFFAEDARDRKRIALKRLDAFSPERGTLFLEPIGVALERRAERLRAYSPRRVEAFHMTQQNEETVRRGE